MRRPVGVKDVAAACGVSVGTVSNVLNRPERVSPATRERVLEQMRLMSFVRNESARLLRAGRSRVVGLVVLDVGNPFFTDVVRGAEATLAEQDLVVMVCSSGEQPERERRYLDLLEEQRVQGVLITPTDAADAQLAGMRKRGTPVVLLDRAASPSVGCSVSVDDVEGGRLVGGHLLELGHERLAFVGGPFSLPQVRDRHHGFADAVSGRRQASLQVVRTSATDVASGRAAGAQLLTAPRSSRATGVFCANDLLALGLLQHLTASGIRVPQDLALVGYDDIDFAASSSVPLSSVRQPRDELGREAARLLLLEADGGNHRHRRRVFSPSLVVRESSGLALGTPGLAGG